MLALREVHACGATRVSISGDHVLTGGADGVVSLFSVKQWLKAPPVWSFKCHEGAVTDVVLAGSLALALSCGRDGRILLHENIFDATKLVSRVICKVTGEVRCLQLDLERRRVFIAGDSLRCLDMAQDRFKILTIPLVVPFPIVSLAVSPCGRFIAMASASGELGVVSAPPSSTALPADTDPTAAAAAATMTTTAAVENAGAKVQFVFRGVLSSTAKKDDAVRYRMAWCHTAAGGLQLMVPTLTEVQVFRLDPPSVSATGAAQAPQMRAIGGLRDRALTDLHAALVYGVSKSKLACAVVSRDGLFIGKVEAKSLAMSRHTSERYTQLPLTSADLTAASALTSNSNNNNTSAVAPAAVTDVQINAVSGDVVVGLADGRVSLLRRASLKEWRPPTADKSTVSKNTAEEDEPTAARAGEEEVKKEKKEKKARKAEKKMRHREQRPEGRMANKKVLVDDEEGDADDFIDDGTASESSADSSSSSSDASSSASSDNSSDDGDVAAEDFEKVVVDLQRSGASVHDNDADRPSRWREADTRAAMAHAEAEAQRERTRSRFLDDEAEEGSTEDDEDDDSVEDGTRHASTRSGRSAARTDVDDYDDASVEGHVEDEDEEAEEDSGLPRGRNGRSDPLRTAATMLASGRMAAVQDYSFQVGATPAGEEGSCYLAYNSVGYIHCSREATTIHFLDISYPAVRLQLRDTVLMGTLSPVGAGFVVVPADAAEAQGSVDEVPRLTILYHAFMPLGAQSEWRVSLAPGETVRCMAAGIRYLAVATSHYLRIFSHSGLELAVLSKGQRIVTMVGTSSRKLMSGFKADFDPLALVTLTGTGEVVMEVINVGARESAVQPRQIPLTELPDGSTHQLQWLGWSEEGFLFSADTAGVVRMYTEGWGGTWVPVYDPRTLVDQSYALWIYGVSNKQIMAYRYSRDDTSYPAAAASGLTTELVPLALPLTRSMNEDGRERWSAVLRQQIASDELKRRATYYSEAIAKYDEVHDRHLQHFFDVALKEQQTTRALDLAMMMEIHERIVRCVKTANNTGYERLVPKLMKLYEMRMSDKSKRRCTLPLKEAVEAEKKRNAMLRKFQGTIMERLNLDKKAEAAPAAKTDTSTAANTAEVKSPLRSPQPSSAPAGGSDVANSPSAVSTATTVDADAHSVHTATTMSSDSQISSAPSSFVRRHISFAPDVPTATAAAQPMPKPHTPNTAVKSSAELAASSASAVPRKVSNPFAKPASATPTSTTTTTTVGTPGEGKLRTPAPATTSAMSASAHQTRRGTAAPPSPSPPFSNTPALPLAGSAVRQTTLLGDSQVSTPPPRTTVMLTQASSSPQPADTQRDDEAATSLSSLSETPEDARVSAGHTTVSPVQPPPPPQTPPQEPPQPQQEQQQERVAPAFASASASSPSVAPPLFSEVRKVNSSMSYNSATASRSGAFVARELPATPSPATYGGGRSGPVDPFLASCAPSHTPSALSILMGGGSGTSTNVGYSEREAEESGPSVSVQSLLDVGHAETAPVVRSDSFGEALRKRYRDDDEGEEDEMGYAPPSALPKLAL